MRKTMFPRAAALACVLAPLALGPAAYAQSGACAKPVTGPMLAEHMRLLDWKETEHVVQNEPGMKKVWDKIPPNYQQQIAANPGAFPWDRFAGNRDQATMDRVEGLIRDARARSVTEKLSGMPWPQLQQALAKDAEFGPMARSPKGTPLQAAQSNPAGTDWKTLLANRDTCQLTALKQSIEAAGVAAK
jgi:hypothetical protein